MAEVKDKVVTVESLSALHKYDKKTYMAKVDPTGSGSLSIGRNPDSVIGTGSIAVGYNTEASGLYSFAEGSDTISSGYAAHSMGSGSDAIGNYSFAGGTNSIANNDTSFAFGQSVIASSDYQFVHGINNIEDTEGKYAHIVGNGLGNGTYAQRNAYTLDWNGNGWFAGSVEASYIVLKSSTANSTKRFMVTVDDTGVLTATEITEN